MSKVQGIILKAYLLLSAVGIADSLFLTQKHYQNSGVNCPLFGGCEVVTSSQYSTIFGVPIALLGLFFYLVIFLLTINTYLANKKEGMIYAAQASIFGFLTSISLVYIMVYVIQALCFYCLISALTSTLLFVLGIFYLKFEKSYFLKSYYDYFFSLKFEVIIWASLRVSLGFIFLWAFIDRLPSWLAGKSPTSGFLQNATSGVFADFFASMSNSNLTDTLYMLGLGLGGIALIFGIAMKLATSGGSLMMFLFYLASALPPEHNPLVDEHIIYIFVLYLLYKNNAGENLGFQKQWRKLKLVRQLPILK